MNANIILEAKALATLDWKPPEHAKLWNLSDEHFCQVVGWMDAGISYKKIRALMAKELELPPAKIPDGITALSQFWSRLRPHFLVARRRAGSSEASAVEAEAGRDPGKFDAATIEELKRLAFDLASSNADPKAVKGIFSLVLKAEDQEIKKSQVAVSIRRVALLEEKMRSASAEIQKLRDPQADLTEADRAAIVAKVDEILGIKKSS